MARTKSSHKRGHAAFHSVARTSPIRFIRWDAWRWVDLAFVIASIGFLISARFSFIPVVFIGLTVIELLFEFAIRKSNAEWVNTKEGEGWVRRMTAAGRLFFIPAKVMIFFIALFLIVMGW